MAYLGTKLTLAVTAFMAVAVAVLAPLRMAHEQNVLIELYSLDGRWVAESIAISSVAPIKSGNLDDLSSLCEQAEAALAPVVACVIYAHTGEILVPNSVGTDSLVEVSQNTQRHWREFRAPIHDQDDDLGEVVLRFDWAPLNTEVRNVAARALIAIIGVTTILIVVLRVLLGHVLLRPILALVRATRHLTSGTFALLPESNRQDEIGELMRSFNVMAQVIATQQANLARQAATDSQTQIANRRQFEQWLQEAWQQATQAHTNMGLLLCDVDYFKRYNDTYGHLAGDTCLRQIGAIMRELSESLGTRVARYGGEEFVILMPGAEAKDLTRVAETLRQRVRTTAIPHLSSPYGYVSLSIGGHILIPSPDNEPDLLIQAADQALYVAKAQGRNQYSASGQIAST